MAVIYRPDYAKFMLHVPAELWTHYYQGFISAAHQSKFHGDFLKSHKTQRLWYNAESGVETWTIEVWGEWAGLVEYLDREWLYWLKRFDVRGIVWDATEDSIVSIGQHLQRNITTTNINVYSTKPRSKRGGRDAGGKGFSIGSHKSDLRITAYKRNNEPCAQEYQMSGSMLKNTVSEVFDLLSNSAGTRSYWQALKQHISDAGEVRMARVFAKAGIGVHWPTFAQYVPPTLPPIQHEYIPSQLDLEEMARHFEETEGGEE